MEKLFPQYWRFRSFSVSFSGLWTLFRSLSTARLNGYYFKLAALTHIIFKRQVILPVWKENRNTMLKSATKA
jgi:hypothetical protein